MADTDESALTALLKSVPAPHELKVRWSMHLCACVCICACVVCVTLSEYASPAIQTHMYTRFNCRFRETGLVIKPGVAQELVTKCLEFGDVSLALLHSFIPHPFVPCVTHCTGPSLFSWLTFAHATMSWLPPPKRSCNRHHSCCPCCRTTDATACFQR